MSATQTVAFDVYGTLVDPVELRRELGRLVGEQAGRFAELWREKQIEYAFRRGLMRAYQPFDVCTRQALQYTMQALGCELSEAAQEELLAQYQQLEPFRDVLPGIRGLQAPGRRLVAFSNGTEAVVRALLRHAGLDAQLDDVVSVDDVRSFKPDPAVYHHLAQRAGTPPARTWLVSSNPWDVIGARSAGLRAAWVKRKADAVFDPWGIEPDLVVDDLLSLTARLPAPTAER